MSSTCPAEQIGGDGVTDGPLGEVGIGGKRKTAWAGEGQWHQIRAGSFEYFFSEGLSEAVRALELSGRVPFRSHPAFGSGGIPPGLRIHGLVFHARLAQRNRLHVGDVWKRKTMEGSHVVVICFPGFSPNQISFSHPA